MALIDKLTAIADGFRTSRGTTQEYTLDEMAVLAAEEVGESLPENAKIYYVGTSFTTATPSIPVVASMVEVTTTE